MVPIWAKLYMVYIWKWVWPCRQEQDILKLVRVTTLMLWNMEVVPSQVRLERTVFWKLSPSWKKFAEPALSAGLSHRLMVFSPLLWKVPAWHCVLHSRILDTCSRVYVSWWRIVKMAFIMWHRRFVLVVSEVPLSSM